jgi:hypothetical protein
MRPDLGRSNIFELSDRPVRSHGRESTVLPRPSSGHPEFRASEGSASHRTEACAAVPKRDRVGWPCRAKMITVLLRGGTRQRSGHGMTQKRDPFPPSSS